MQESTIRDRGGATNERWVVSYCIRTLPALGDACGSEVRSRQQQFIAETPSSQRSRRESLGEIKYFSADAIFQHGYIEIDQQSDRPASQLKIGQKLGVVDWRQTINGPYFHNYQSGNEEVPIGRPVE